MPSVGRCERQGFALLGTLEVVVRNNTSCRSCAETYMRKLIQFGAMVAAGTGMLAAQWLNLPVERAEFRAEPLTVARMESTIDAEAEFRRNQVDERAARAVLAGFACGEEI